VNLMAHLSDKGVSQLLHSSHMKSYTSREWIRVIDTIFVSVSSTSTVVWEQPCTRKDEVIGNPTDRYSSAVFSRSWLGEQKVLHCDRLAPFLPPPFHLVFVSKLRHLGNLSQGQVYRYQVSAIPKPGRLAIV